MLSTQKGYKSTDFVLGSRGRKKSVIYRTVSVYSVVGEETGTETGGRENGEPKQKQMRRDLGLTGVGVGKMEGRVCLFPSQLSSMPKKMPRVPALVRPAHKCTAFMSV